MHDDDILHLGKTNCNHVSILWLHGCEIKQTSKEKDLGIIIDSQLKFHKHAHSCNC